MLIILPKISLRLSSTSTIQTNQRSAKTLACSNTKRLDVRSLGRPPIEISIARSDLHSKSSYSAGTYFPTWQIFAQSAADLGK